MEVLGDLSETKEFASFDTLLDTERLGRDFLFLPQTGSTNDEIKRRAEDGAREGLVLIADIQTKGKGRKGRTWETPEGTNIAMSLLLRPDISPDLAPMMTLVMALAAAEGIRKVSGLDAKIKWPNDIVINGKKAAGILTEMSVEEGRILYVVTGIGINVNNKTLPEELRDAATSMLIESGRNISRAETASAIVNTFEDRYETFLESGDLKDLRTEYEKLCVNIGSRVRILDPAGEYDAEALGISDRGELKVIRDDGTEEDIYAGEVSVRGIGGYV